MNMINIIRKLLILCFVTLLGCSTKKENSQVVAISCGQCNFDLKSQAGCDLAVKIEGKAYFVAEYDIDHFGDAHDPQTGFCEVVRKAVVEGEINEGKFIASSIKLVE